MHLDRSEQYNLGNGQGFSVLQVIETAREITGHPIPVRQEPRRPGDPPVLVGSADKIKSELGWKPKYPELKHIIQSAWEWHRQHPKGYPVEQQAPVPSENV
jgi:UDP-glucose 4-epimerase